MANLNKVTLIGRLGHDPEIRYTQSGSAVANATIATNDYWTDKQGEKQERTEWHSLVLWGKLADLAQSYLKKGSQVYVEGQLSTRKWKDEQTGQDKYSTEVLIQGYNSSLTMLGGGNQNNINQQQNDKQNISEDSQVTQNELDDDIPF